jgi:hypothetical protein
MEVTTPIERPLLSSVSTPVFHPTCSPTDRLTINSLFAAREPGATPRSRIAGSSRVGCDLFGQPAIVPFRKGAKETYSQGHTTKTFLRTSLLRTGRRTWAACFLVLHIPRDIDDRRLAIVAARVKVPRAAVIGFVTILKTHASRATDRGSVTDFDIEECVLHEGLDAANQLYWREGEGYVRPEIERPRLMQDSDSGDDWPKDYLAVC